MNTLQEYLNRPDAFWKGQRAHSMRMIGHCFANLVQSEVAWSWLMRACAEDPSLRENWIDLAQACHDARDWAGGYHACLRALAITERSLEYETHGYAWGERPHDLAAVCAWYLGLKGEAAEQLRQALALNPNDPRLRDNARFILPGE